VNSASLVNKGYKVYEFVNGDRIDVTFSKEMYSGLFIGTLRSEAAESIIWTDKENGLRAEITFGKVKKRYTTPNLDLLITSNLPFTTKASRFAPSTAHTAGT